MPIKFACSCGKSYTVDDALAGKRTRCPACKAALVVPALAPPEEEPIADLELVEDERAASYGLAVEAPRPAVKRKREPEEDAEPEEATSGRPEYFVVAYDGGNSLIHNPKFFRVYSDGDALLFIHSGPFNWSAVDAMQAQARARGMAAQTGAMHGADVGLGMGLLAAAGMALFNALDAKELAKRAAVLDPMSIDELRAEADKDKNSFQVAPDNTTDSRIEPPATGIWANKNIEPKIVGRVRFRHDPTGKWALLLLTRPDARAAIRAFRRVLGRENVEVELRLKRDRE